MSAAASNQSTSDSGSSFTAAAEMEHMRKEDLSWHPCYVSLSVAGVGLVIKYENADSGNILLNGKEALSGLRMRSLPLNGDDCAQIQEGDHVLATAELQSNSLFFEAVVKKTLRVRHSKRAACRCTFEIKWLNRDRNERSLAVTASLIMKLATTSINEHPTICSFMSMLKNSTSSTSPELDIENDIDHEMDLQKLLDKQIEMISNSVDNSMDSSPKEFLLGVQFKNEGEVQSRVAEFEVTKPNLLLPSNSTTSQRITRNQGKLQKDVKSANPTPAFSLIQELPENQSLRNPLPPLASIASLLSKLPPEEKFNANLSFVKSLYGTKSETTSSSYEPQSSDTSYGISILEKANGSISIDLNCSEAKRKLNSASSPNMTKIARAEIANDVTHRETHVGNKNVFSPANSLSRVTRSAKQGREERISDKLIKPASTVQSDQPTINLVVELFCEEKSNLGKVEGKELEAQQNASVGLGSSANTRRRTRSQVLKEEKTPAAAQISLLEKEKFAEITKSLSFGGEDCASHGKVAGSAEIRKVEKYDPPSKKLESGRSLRSRAQKN